MKIEPQIISSNNHPRIVFLHGRESGPHGAKYLALEALDKQIIAPDCTGKNFIDDRMAIIEKALFSINQMVIVGSSYGAACALVFAKQNIHRIHACILCAPALQLLPEDFEPSLPSNTIIIHGKNDHIVPFMKAKSYSLRHGIPIIALDDDHRLIASVPILLAVVSNVLANKPKPWDIWLSSQSNIN